MKDEFSGIESSLMDENINSSAPLDKWPPVPQIHENFYILIWISLQFVPKGPIDNKPALVQVMVTSPYLKQC